MSRKRRLPPPSPQRARVADVLKENIETSATEPDPKVGATDATTVSGRGYSYNVPVKEYLGTTSKRSLFDNKSWREVLEVVALIAMVVAVIWFGYSLDANLDDVEDKIDTIHDKISDVEGITQRNEIKLNNLTSTVIDIRREVNHTKDLVNESRVEQARSSQQSKSVDDSTPKTPDR